jgi:hypothetical protein
VNILKNKAIIVDKRYFVEILASLGHKDVYKKKETSNRSNLEGA